MRAWLKEMRLKRGMTQKQLALSVGIDMTLISKYERGDRTPRARTAKEIASVLKFPWTRFYD